MKILLALDGSASSKHMLSYLAAHEELLGPDREYTALTVVPPLPQHVAGYLPADVVREHYAEQAELVLRPVRAFAEQQRWKVDVREVVGHAGQVIAETAEKGRFDLVMMGSHGHGALVGAVMGSVATQVLARCKTPVLLIR